MAVIELQESFPGWLWLGDQLIITAGSRVELEELVERLKEWLENEVP